MFYHKESNIYIREGTDFTIGDTQYTAQWLNQSSLKQKVDIGLEEVIVMGSPENDQYYFVSIEYEGNEAHYINTRKPQEMIDQMEQSKVETQISQLESQMLLPRVTREFMLIAFETQASAAGIDPMTNYAYRKVKGIDDEITSLRSKL
jgi:hypothetical protein